VYFSALAGLGLGFSLIVAIGAQNLFVLRQGMRREKALLSAAICAVSDAALIALGVSGIGLALHAAPWLFDVARWGGAAFLIGYGTMAARRALRLKGGTLDVTPHPEPSVGARTLRVATGTTMATATRTGGVVTAARRSVVLTCLALTWLNPHVYLDTVFLLGTVANSHGEEGRWAFAAGAVLASLVWFFGLALGARLLSGWLATPRAWQIFDVTVATVMIALGLSLVLAQ